MAEFDPNARNVVAFGDSNTWVFGPALRRWLEARKHATAAQVVVKYRSGSRPSHWIAGAAKGLWSGDLKFSHGPSVEEALSEQTALVLIGLGGNMVATRSGRESIARLVRQVEERAPRARIVWRGPPPATARKDGVRATVERKLGRYVLNALVKRELTQLGFAVVDAQSLEGRDWGPTARRIYVDLMSLHAGGPAGDDPKRVGRAVDLELEQEVLESAPRPAAVVGEVAESGPWDSFVRARDNIKSATHVPSAAAADLIELLGARGVLDLDAAAPKRKNAELWRVVDADSRVRRGPPSFRWRNHERLAVGMLVRIEETHGKYVRVSSLAGADEGWTVKSNLMPEEPDAPLIDPGPPPPLVVVPDIYTVVDKAAWIRKGPPGFEPKSGKPSIEYMSRVRIDRTEGINSEVRTEAGEAIGWTRSANLQLLFKDAGSLLAAPLRPRTPARSGGSRTAAKVYDRAGGLMERLAAEVGIDVAAVLAVWLTESGGDFQTPDQMTIRFENHVFFSRWGKNNPAVFDAHFQFAKRNGVAGTKKSKSHRFRTGKGAWRTFHGNQAAEYEVLALAIELSGKSAAYKSISMGGPQIMGFNHRILGFATPREMYEAFQSGERVQVLAFFDFLRRYRPREQLIRLLQQGDFGAFALAYNGSAAYERKVRKWYERALSTI